jgi:hypothetical protein
MFVLIGDVPVGGAGGAGGAEGVEWSLLPQTSVTVDDEEEFWKVGDATYMQVPGHRDRQMRAFVGAFQRAATHWFVLRRVGNAYGGARFDQEFLFFPAGAVVNTQCNTSI